MDGKKGKWECSWCNAVLCGDCVEEVGAGMVTCSCGGACKPYVSLEKETQILNDEKLSLGKLLSAFTYPLSTNGIIMLVIGAVIVGFSMFIRFMSGSAVGILIGFVGSSYLLAFVMDILLHTGNGKDEVPDWPDIIHYRSIAGLGSLAVLISYLPAILYCWKVPDFSVGTAVILFFGGTFYMPMALLYVAVHRGIKALNPFVVLPAIFRVLVPYTMTLAVLFSVQIAALILSSVFTSIPVAGYLLIAVATLYFSMVQMRMLGLVYRSNPHLLDY